jgi:hypothetical protein
MTVFILVDSPVLRLDFRSRLLVDDFIEAKKAAEGEARGIRQDAESRYFENLREGIEGEVAVARLLNLPLPDLTIHRGAHTPDVGALQVKTYDATRPPAWRSFTVWSDMLDRAEGSILMVARRGDRFRPTLALTYADARQFQADPRAASQQRLRSPAGARKRCIYVGDLRREGCRVLWNVWSHRVIQQSTTR